MAKWAPPPRKPCAARPLDWPGVCSGSGVRPLLLSFVALAALPLGALLLAVETPPAAPARPGDAMLPARRSAAVALTPAIARTVAAPAPAPTVQQAARSVEDLLEAVDEERPLSADDLARLEAAWTDGALDLPLRAGALRAVLERGGREALARAVDAFHRAEVAALREHLAHAVARGAGPDDGPLVERLLDRAQAARDEGADEARELAALAAVRAARREDDPVPLDPALEARLARTLGDLARTSASADPVEALAALRTPAALDALDALARTASDEERRLEAALALSLADPTRGAAALAALAPTLTDPLLRDRLRVETEPR